MRSKEKKESWRTNESRNCNLRGDPLQPIEGTINHHAYDPNGKEKKNSRTEHEAA
jgi:hypothetical protein